MHQLLTDFLTEQPDWEYETERSYKNRIKPFLEHLTNENLDLVDVEYKHFNIFLGLLKKKKLSWSFRIGVYQSVKKFWSWLHANGHIAENFFKTRDDLLSRPRKPKKLHKMVAQSVALKLLETAIHASRTTKGQIRITAIRDAAIMAIFLTTGLRREEVVNLDLSNITFSTLGQSVDCLSLFVRGKFERERHQHTTDTTAILLVRNWLANRKAAPGEPALFTVLHRNRFGNIHTRISVRTINQRMFFWRKKAGFGVETYVSPHGWRHLYGTLFAENGGTAFQLKELLGHSQISTTEIYVHMSQKRTQEAAHEYAPKISIEID